MLTTLYLNLRKKKKKKKARKQQNRDIFAILHLLKENM